MREFLTLVQMRGGETIRFFPPSALFMIGDSHFHFSTAAKSDLICQMATLAPMAMTHQEVVSVFRRHNLGNSEDTPARAAAKLIKGVRDDLLAAGVHVPLIISERTVGYRLAPGWRAQEHKPREVPTLDELRQIIDRCKAFCTPERVRRDNSGLEYLDTTDFDVAAQFAEASAHLLRAVRSAANPRNRSRVFRLKSACWELLSYVAFWRFGEKHTTTDWVEEYHSEIDALFSEISLMLDSMADEFV